MGLNYITIGLSLIIFIIYLIIFFMIIKIKNKLIKESEMTFICLTIAMVFLIIIRIQNLFYDFANF